MIKCIQNAIDTEIFGIFCFLLLLLANTHNQMSEHNTKLCMLDDIN